MDILSHLLAALSPFHLLLAVGGVVAGTIIAALPGLTATMAIAVLTPLTFGLPPASALVALGAIYTGGIFGGCYAAILTNTTAHPSSNATPSHPLLMSFEAPRVRETHIITSTTT